MMDRQHVPPLHVEDAPIMELPTSSDMWAPGVRRRVLAHDSETGEITYVSQLPADYRRAHEAAFRDQHEPGRFEYHDCHEEGFILDGRYSFGGWYDWDAVSYLNHPPTWVHPADQCIPNGAQLLMKLSGPLAFDYVEIPAGWDGQEYALDPKAAAPYEGITNVRLPDPTALDEPRAHHRRLWTDPVRGWTTWYVQLPPGWVGEGPGGAEPGGDELFVVRGDIRLRLGDELVDLVEGHYACEPDALADGGRSERSIGGCTLLRWTRGGVPAGAS